ncbi:hypothetical protein MRQ36_30260 [Micromonospora sp. R77]|uniref:hypothetical protein n=1 Tax=Micromonospora sp. R77 TaxID=2925836 RepID=UPI001F608E5F|nr:hypothetical protein [Micromonospora sp. R77]MCI4066611.1 hypothetical protein [Micromonospora sp. R77]
MRHHRAALVHATLATLGLLTIGWLLATGTTRPYYDLDGDRPGAPTLTCAPVLAAPHGSADTWPDDRHEYATDGGTRVDHDSAVRTTAACQQLRGRTLGWALLLAIPTTVLTTLAITGRRRTDH